MRIPVDGSHLRAKRQHTDCVIPQSQGNFQYKIGRSFFEKIHAVEEKFPKAADIGLERGQYLIAANLDLHIFTAAK